MAINTDVESFKQALQGGPSKNPSPTGPTKKNPAETPANSSENVQGDSYSFESYKPDTLQQTNQALEGGQGFLSEVNRTLENINELADNPLVKRIVEGKNKNPQPQRRTQQAQTQQQVKRVSSEEEAQEVMQNEGNKRKTTKPSKERVATNQDTQPETMEKPKENSTKGNTDVFNKSEVVDKVSNYMVSKYLNSINQIVQNQPDMTVETLYSQLDQSKELIKEQFEGELKNEVLV